MRIEKVVIENINSLFGRFVIDFTDRAYYEGLFAIVGPSGAGKSTVLDAICLALYGRTPRITVSDMHDEAMNRSAETCRTEVVFVSGAKRYLSVFEHKRTIRSAKPFMSPKNELYECLADGSRQALSDNSSEAKQKVIEVIGLDYDQFTRSVMLAQFRFAEFLSAKPNDRAAILEQVSGTDIYRRISIAVFEKQKSFANMLREISFKKDAVSVLEPEVVSSIEAELKRIDEDTSGCETLSQSLAECAGALSEHDRQTKAFIGFEQKKAEITKAKQQSAVAFEAAQKEEQNQRQASKDLNKTIASVRELDVKITGQQNELSRLEGEAKNAENDILDHKKAILGILKKHLPDADNDALKELYEAHNEADLLTKRLSGELGGKESQQKELETGLKQQLSGRSEKSWQDELETSEQAILLVQALLAAVEAQEELKKLREKLIKLQTDQKQTEDKAKENDEKFLFTQLQQKFADERSKLKDGEPCPLCGALHHPDKDKQLDVSFIAAAEQEKNQLKAKLDRIYSDITQINFAVSTQVRIISNSEEALKGKDELLKSLGTTDLEELAKRKAFVKQLLSDARAVREQLSALSAEVLELTKKLGEVDKDVSEIKHAKAAICEIEKRKAAYEKQRTAAEEIRKGFKAKRQAQFEDKDPDDEEEKQAKILSAAEQSTAKARSSLEEVKTLEAGNAADIERTKAEIKTLEDRITDTYSDVSTRVKFVKTRLTEHDETHEAIKQQIDSLKGTAYENKETILQLSNSVGSLTKRLRERKGEAKNTLSIEEQNRSKLAQLEQQEKKTGAEFKKWSDLCGIIGSADGSKFARIAQGITFDVLLVYANESLCKMSDRYILIRDEDNQASPLEINVVDSYQAGEIRPVSNLSGGESFVVSLALALGLSEMSSGRTLIDSLFIDEGFASLDEDYLELALSTLSTLGNRQNKLIGVISHVKELKERIDTQIEVTKLTGGRSTLKGPGVIIEL